VRANGQVVANLTLKQFEKDDQYLKDTSTIANSEQEEDQDLLNIFAKGKKPMKMSMSKSHKDHPPNHSKESVPRNSLPKIQFPTFEGDKPPIWFGNYENYFSM
jgi:hypothetical protein